MKFNFKNLLLSLFALSLVACETPTNPIESDSEKTSESVSGKESTSTADRESTSEKESESSSEKDSENQSEEVDTKEKAIKNAKARAKSKYDDSVKVADAEQKEYLLIVYDNLIIQIELADGSLDEVKEALDNLISTFNKACENIIKVVNTFVDLKNQAIAQVNAIYDSVTKVINKENIDYVKSIYDEVILKINEVKQSNNAKDDFEKAIVSFKEAAVNYSKNIINEITAKAIKTAKDTLDTLLSSTINQVKDVDIKAKLQAAHDKAKLEFASICSNVDYAALIESITKEYRKEFIKFASDFIEQTLPEIKEFAIDTVTETLDSFKEVFDNKKIKETIESIKNTATKKIDELTDISQAKSKVEEIINEAYDAGIDALKDYISNQVQSLFDTECEKITDNDIKKEIETYIDDAKNEIDKLSTLDEIKEAISDLIKEAEEKVKDLVIEQINKLVLEAQDKLDTYVDGLIEKIDDNTINASVNEVYEKAKDELDKITSLDDIDDAIKAIYDDAIEKGEKILSDYIASKLKDLKDEAIEKVDALYDQAKDKIEDNDIKTELDTLYVSIKKDIDDIKDLDSAKDALDKIIDDATDSIKALLLEAYKDIIDAAKAKLDAGILLIKSNIDTTKYNQAKAIYDTCVEELKKIDTDKDIEEQLTAILTKFKNDAKTYCSESIASYIDTAFDKACVAINEYIEEMQIQEYINTLNTLITTTENSLKELNDLFTIVEDTATQLEEFAKSALDTFKEYQAAWADIVIANTLKSGEDYYNDALKSDEYKNLGLGAKAIAKAKIELAYADFETAVNKLPDVGISLACEELLDALITTIDNAIGRTTTE